MNALKQCSYPLLKTAFGLLILSGCSGGNGTMGDIAEREAMVRVVLAHEAKEWRSSRGRVPCVRSQLTEREDASGAILPVSNLPQEWLPSPFLICEGENPGSFLSLAAPDILTTEAFVDVDFRCGEMCGAGRTYHLVRAGKEWKVFGQSTRWIS